MFNRIYNLIIKELLAALRDPKSVVLIIVPPLMQIFLFSFAVTQEVKNVTLAVLNQDRGIEGSSLVKYFDHTATFTKVIYLRNRNEINPAIDNQLAIAVLVIPQDFSECLLSRSKAAELQILIDGRKSNAAPIVGGYMQKIIRNFTLRHKVHNTSDVQGINVETRNWFNSNLNPQNAMVPCLICLLSTIVGMILSALSIARERETGTFEQLLVAPFTPLEILIGKAIPALLLATFSGTMITFVVIYGFRIPLQGSFLLLFISLEVFLLSVIGIGLFISSLSMTQQQALLGCFLVMPPLIMLSGFATPFENMPTWLQSAMVVNPIMWFVQIIKGLFLRNTPAGVLLLYLLPILCIGIFNLSVAAIMFKRRME
ncbi:MAG: ABC transporter permease [Planctomycetaceae bacterium]|nr:ABC transporter permease [Planctomycetaceae bacterium]